MALTWEAPNQIGTWTFLVLWVMRLSAKLNVFLGVPNLGERVPAGSPALPGELLPQAADEPAVPGLGDAVDRWPPSLLVQARVAPGSGRFETAGFTFLATLVALALLEHWFLVLPLPAARPVELEPAAARRRHARRYGRAVPGPAGRSQRVFHRQRRR